MGWGGGGVYGAACSLVAKVLDWDLEGWGFKCSHNKISAAVEPLSKALNLNLHIAPGGIGTCVV